MKVDTIKEIKIDNLGRLCIFPETEQFTGVYRTATEVHWDKNEFCLYSPKPREWSYLKWYKHIMDVAKNECSCELLLTNNTVYIDIPEVLKKEILAA